MADARARAPRGARGRRSLVARRACPTTARSSSARWTTVAFSDKGTTGTNHVLPTGRAARYSGGLSRPALPQAADLPAHQRAGGVARIGRGVAEISAAEGLPAHGATATRRLARLAAVAS